MSVAIRTILIGIFILLACLWLYAYQKLPAERDTVILKDTSKISGRIVKQDFGKFVVVEKPDNQLQVVLWDQVRDIQLFNAPWYLRVDDMLEGIIKLGVIGGFLVFLIGLWQYGQTQKWKRAEFLLQEVRKFEASNNVQNVKVIIQNEQADIYLFGRTKPDGNAEQPVTVTRNMLKAAVETDADLVQKQTPEEKGIVVAINTFLSYLDHFNNIVDAGLIKKKELKLYLIHWLDILGNKRNQKLAAEIREQLWRYMKGNGYDGTLQLLRKFGYSVPSDKSTSNVFNSLRG